MIHHQNQTLWRSFNVYSALSNQSYDQTKCKHCFIWKHVVNATHMKNHLKKCKKFLNNYLSNSTHQNEFLVIEIKKEKTHARNRLNSSFLKFDIVFAFDLTQFLLKYSKFTVQNQVEIDELLFRTLYYIDNKLNLFNYYIWIATIKKLNFFYKIFYRDVFFDFFLNRAYQIMNEKIMQIVQSNDCINFVIDDFDNINQKRIINLFCCIEKNIYYLCNENIFDVKHEIDILAKWLDDKMRFYCEKNIKKINSYVTNIESKMRNIYSILIVQKNSNTCSEFFAIVMTYNFSWKIYLSFFDSMKCSKKFSNSWFIFTKTINK